MKVPRVLIVYANPAIAANPVPPYGTERIAKVLRDTGCEVQVIMPFMTFHPRQTLKNALDWQPDFVGFSIRNLDDALVIDSAYGDKVIDTNFFCRLLR